MVLGGPWGRSVESRGKALESVGKACAAKVRTRPWEDINEVLEGRGEALAGKVLARPWECLGNVLGMSWESLGRKGPCKTNGRSQEGSEKALKGIEGLVSPRGALDR